MQNNKILKRIAIVFLTLTLFNAPQLSYADWGVGIHIGDRDGDHHFYRWHEHPHWGLHIHFLPVGYITVRVGFHRYFYFDGLYYNYVGGDYVLVSPPIGAYVTTIPADFQPVIINGRTYYTDSGVYYILTRRHGYKVVVAPVAIATQDTFPVNIPNNSGGYSTIVIKKSGNGFVGPQGEFYPQFPKVAQLKVMYGK